MESEERNELDRLVEDALSTYCRQEPESGLEERVLNRIREAGIRPKFRFVFPGWAVAAPVVACVTIVIVTFWSPRPTQPDVSHVLRSGGNTATANIKQPEPAITAPTPPQHKMSRRPGAMRSALPKRQQFPTPAPMTGEERALLAFVRNAPEEARKILIDGQQSSTELIQAEEISIAPLQSDGL